MMAQVAGRAEPGRALRGRPATSTASCCLHARRRPAAGRRWSGSASRPCSAAAPARCASRDARPTSTSTTGGGAQGACEHLLRQGRWRIATIAGPQDMGAGVDRLAGYRERWHAARASGPATSVALGDFSGSRARPRCDRLLAARPDVDAVFAASDLMAVGALRALREAGRRVPEDVAVVGFDDFASPGSRAAADHRPPADRGDGPADGPAAARPGRRRARWHAPHPEHRADRPRVGLAGRPDRGLVQELRRFRLDSTLPVLYDLSGIGGIGGSAAWARGGCHATETSGRAVGGRDGGRPGRRGGTGERRRRVGAAPAEPEPGRPAPAHRTGPGQRGVPRLRPDEVDVSAFRQGLPTSYQPKVMTRLWHGIDEPIGIDYSYDYRVRFADSRYEDRFFGQLAKLAKPAPVTAFQTDYNAQQANAARRHEQPSHRRAERREVAGEEPARRGGHPPEHGLPDQLVRPRRLQVPRLHQDRRAGPGHRLQLRHRAGEPQDRRVGWHDCQRRGERSRQHPPDLVPRPVRRTGGVDRQLERRRCGPRRRWRSRTTAFRPPGSTPPAGTGRRPH